MLLVDVFVDLDSMTSHSPCLPPTSLAFLPLPACSTPIASLKPRTSESSIWPSASLSEPLRFFILLTVARWLLSCCWWLQASVSHLHPRAEQLLSPDVFPAPQKQRGIGLISLPPNTAPQYETPPFHCLNPKLRSLPLLHLLWTNH